MDGLNRSPSTHPAPACHRPISRSTHGLIICNSSYTHTHARRRRPPRGRSAADARGVRHPPPSPSPTPLPPLSPAAAAAADNGSADGNEPPPPPPPVEGGAKPRDQGGLERAFGKGKGKVVIVKRGVGRCRWMDVYSGGCRLFGGVDGGKWWSGGGAFDWGVCA